jgi:hypothetical protein
MPLSCGQLGHRWSLQQHWLLRHILLTGNLLSPDARVVGEWLVTPTKAQAVNGEHPANRSKASQAAHMITQL